jgi:ABC-type Mn2+/Zn2+ transport system ATPase subunit
MSAVDEKTKSDLITTLKNVKAEGRDLVISTSNPEHYTWLDEVLLVEEPEGQSTRVVKNLNMASALSDKKFIALLRKEKG